MHSKRSTLCLKTLAVGRSAQKTTGDRIEIHREHAVSLLPENRSEIQIERLTLNSILMN